MPDVTPLRVIVLINQKGGCGKTTSALSLAAGLALEGFQTTLVDLDSQCNATSNLGIDVDTLNKQRKYTAADVFLAKRKASDAELSFGERFGGNLHLLPGHRGLGSITFNLEAEVQTALVRQDDSVLAADDIRNEQRLRLKQSLESLRSERDIVVIDCPPDLGFLTTAALLAATHYVIPVKPSGYDLDGLERLTQTIRRTRERLNPNLAPLAVLLTMVNSRARLDSQMRTILENTFGRDIVSPVNINESVSLRQATLDKLTIYELDQNSTPARQYGEFTQNIIARLGLTSRGVLQPMPPKKKRKAAGSAPKAASAQVESSVEATEAQNG
jgi:chromosome partitioning protein